MSEAKSPRGPDGEPLCEWCGGEIRQPGIGRRRAYCRASCRQRAYEERKFQKRLAALVDRPAPAPAPADSNSDSSRGEAAESDSPRDESRSREVGEPEAEPEAAPKPPVPRRRLRERPVPEPVTPALFPVPLWPPKGDG